TRLAEELAVHARRRGVDVLWGRCPADEGAPAFWPWTQLLQSHLLDRDQDSVRALLGASAADIARLVPSLRARLPGVPEPPQLDPEQARFRLFESIVTLLRNASNAAPLTLILDDLQWADTPSMLALAFLARELDHARRLVRLATGAGPPLGRAGPG